MSGNGKFPACRGLKHPGNLEVEALEFGAFQDYAGSVRACLLVLLAVTSPARSQDGKPEAQDAVRDAVMQALRPELSAHGRDGDLGQFLSILPADQRAAALRALSSREQAFSSDLAVQTQLSAAYLALGSGPQALATAEKVLERDPRNPDALAVKARVLAARGDITAARRLLAEIPPGHRQAALVVAAIKLSRGPSDEAAHLKGVAPATHDLSGEDGGTNGGEWTPADYERANSEAKGHDRAPGGKLDRALPDLARNAASQSLANTPLGPLAQRPSGEEQSSIRTAAEAALAVSGTVLLFGGLGGKQLEERLPGIRKSMVIGAVILGASAAGALSLSSVSIPPMALTAPAAPQLALAGASSMGTGSAVVIDGASILAGVKGLVQIGGAIVGAKVVSEGVSYAKQPSGTGDTASAGAASEAPRKRDELLGKVQDPELRDAIDKLYRDKAAVGDGSSMDAYRYESKTGIRLSNSGHGTKLIERRTQLMRILRKPGLSAGDRQIAKVLLTDIQEALSVR